MNLKTDDLINFCTYYTLASASHKLSFQNQIPKTSNNNRKPRKENLSNRPKFEVQPKKEKAVKRKLQYSPTPTRKKVEDKVEVKRIDKSQNNHQKDIDFFISLIGKDSVQRNWHPEHYKQREAKRQ